MDNISPGLKDVITRYRAEVEKLGVHVEAVYLFGSQKTGAATEDSDIDLIVVSPDFARKNLRERLEMLGLAAGRSWSLSRPRVTPDEIKRRKLSIFWRTMLEQEAVVV